MAFYDMPEDRAGTVFDPGDETFGPIMAALQAGEFESAAGLVLALAEAGRPRDWADELDALDVRWEAERLIGEDYVPSDVLRDLVRQFGDGDDDDEGGQE